MKKKITILLLCEILAPVLLSILIIYFFNLTHDIAKYPAGWTTSMVETFLNGYSFLLIALGLTSSILSLILLFIFRKDDRKLAIKNWLIYSLFSMTIGIIILLMVSFSITMLVMYPAF